jgi:MerR HTH family regulatory protein
VSAGTTSRRTTVKLTPVRASGAGRLVEVDVLARAAGMHPDLVRRLVRLGVVERGGGTAQAPLFRIEGAAQLARAVRLRRDLGLNVAGVLLAGELLARIDELEERLRRSER